MTYFIPVNKDDYQKDSYILGWDYPTDRYFVSNMNDGLIKFITDKKAKQIINRVG